MIYLGELGSALGASQENTSVVIQELQFIHFTLRDTYVSDAYSGFM